MHGTKHKLEAGGIDPVCCMQQRTYMHGHTYKHTSTGTSMATCCLPLKFTYLLSAATCALFVVGWIRWDGGRRVPYAQATTRRSRRDGAAKVKTHHGEFSLYSEQEHTLYIIFSVSLHCCGIYRKRGAQS